MCRSRTTRMRVAGWACCPSLPEQFRREDAGNPWSSVAWDLAICSSKPCYAIDIYCPWASYLDGVFAMHDSQGKEWRL